MHTDIITSAFYAQITSGGKLCHCLMFTMCLMENKAHFDARTEAKMNQSSTTSSGMLTGTDFTRTEAHTSLESLVQYISLVMLCFLIQL